mmetsp:Transcript_8707/g.19700  ORF Transcript_8707/g.19700 Transcript_8707/m.19700 type:complete len:95 (-) Transcript_8707:13-297(-)
MCQGDCDSDAECGDGLVCYLRSANEPVPYCHGVALADRDYCSVPEGTTPDQVMALGASSTSGAAGGGGYVGKQKAVVVVVAAFGLIGSMMTLFF